MVNPNVDGYAETTNQKTYWKPIKRILNSKYKLSGTWFWRLSGQGSQIAPLPSHQLLHCNKHFKKLK